MFLLLFLLFFFFKQKTAYEMRISDWSSDVCSSDLLPREAMTSLLRDVLPQARDEEIAALIAAGQGSPGRALGFAGLDLAALARALATIAAAGAPPTPERSQLAESLALHAAQPPYEAPLGDAAGRGRVWSDVWSPGVGD